MTNSLAASAAPRRIRLTAEGITAGIIGGATIALWFLVLDSLHGHPLYTPSLLGTAIFRPATPVAPPETLPVSVPMVLLFLISEVIARFHDRRRARNRPFADLSPDEASPL